MDFEKIILFLNKDIKKYMDKRRLYSSLDKTEGERLKYDEILDSIRAVKKLIKLRKRIDDILEKNNITLKELFPEQNPVSIPPAESKEEEFD